MTAIRVAGHTIIEAFYAFRTQFGGAPRPRGARTPRKMFADAVAYEAWCAEHKVDPIAFMKGRFTHLKQTVGKTPSIRALKSKTALAAWVEWREGVYLEERAAERLHERSRGACEDPMLAQRVRHFAVSTPAFAQLRRRYRAEGREQICEADRDYTGGYDPREPACRTCPRKSSCLARGNTDAGFDVGALRAGVHAALSQQVRHALDTLDPCIAPRAVV
ncbi:MAG: hypothetical protein M3Q55_11790 [Acidobacteriota bacterium]|nr:hypothetical protein [Acidobacteriota bacterium]